MINMNIFEIGEEVYVKAVITGKEFEGDDVRYNLKTNFANNDIGHRFKSEEIVPIEKA